MGGGSFDFMRVGVCYHVAIGAGFSWHLSGSREDVGLSLFGYSSPQGASFAIVLYPLNMILVVGMALPYRGKDLEKCWPEQKAGIFSLLKSVKSLPRTRSRATRLFPPSGIIISAHRLLGSTN